MAEYYSNRSPVALLPITDTSDPLEDCDITVTDFDKHRETLLSNDDRDEEGWESELRRYLGTVQRDIKKDVDVVKWWQVSLSSY